MSDYEKGLRRLARALGLVQRKDAWEDEFIESSVALFILRRELLPLLEAAEQTIEFYDAHGGPMGKLRTEISKWRG